MLIGHFRYQIPLALDFRACYAFAKPQNHVQGMRLAGDLPLKVISPTGTDYFKSIFGIVLISPEVCLEDPDHLGEFLTGPFIGIGIFKFDAMQMIPIWGLTTQLSELVGHMKMGI